MPDNEVFRHLAAFNCFYTYRFQGIAEIDQRLVVIQFSRNASPRVQANIDAMGFVLVGLPAWWIAVVAGNVPWAASASI